MLPAVALLGLDPSGNSESAVALWDFKNFPEIADGLNLLSSPAPVLDVVTPAGQPALTIGPLLISGTQIQALISITGGTPKMRYQTVCKGYFSATQWRYVYGDILLIGPT